MSAHESQFASSSTTERRVKRSEIPEEALQLLVEAVQDRSETTAVALVDGDGRILAGVGAPRQLKDLARIAHPAVRGDDVPEMERILEGTDVFARTVHVGGRELILAALGSRVRRMQDAARAVTRIATPVAI